MNTELLSLLKHKQKTQRRWKQDQTTWNEYREVVKVETQQGRPEGHLKLNLAKDIQDHKKCFSKYINNKRKKRIMWAHC